MSVKVQIKHDIEEYANIRDAVNSIDNASDQEDNQIIENNYYESSIDEWSNNLMDDD